VDVYHTLDTTRPDDVTSIARSDPPRWVIHLAGAVPPTAEAQMWLANVGSTVGLLQGLAAAGCRDVRVVTVGSAAEYQPQPTGALTEASPCGPVSVYGRAKWAQTLLALNLGRELGLAVMVVRPFNLVGPGMSADLVAGWLCQQFAQAADGHEIAIGNTRSARDFIDIRDAVAAYWLVAQRGQPGKVYNVCSGRPVAIEQMLTMLGELTGKSPRIRVDPARLRDDDPQVSYGDYARLHQVTGWQPGISLRESLAAMLAALSDEQS
jgi:GDP-4-dehydro-6-deoxy-D-mannose reductase